MKKKSILCLMIMAVAAVALIVPDADAYDRYKNASGTPGSNCSACHGDFTSGESMKSPVPVFPSNNKHTMHRNTMGTACDLCHTDSDGRNPWIGSSNGTAANPGVGCTGCHEGVGLRAHHAWAGVTFCSACHPGDPTPDPENFNPIYYGTIDTFADNPCNPVAAAYVNENWTIGDFLGLDNDGDGLYDTADPDCEVCVPTGLPDNNCDGIDDDCNGTPDDAYVAIETLCGVGVCANTGLLECQNGQAVNTCAELPQDEANDVTCDGRDGDCDGSIDEDYTPVTTTCGAGECAGNTGAEECQNGTVVDTCDPLAGATPEVCDGSLDEDCDGTVDEGCGCTDGATRSCGSDIGACVSGTETCAGGAWDGNCVGEIGPIAEVCDNIDNDCDGTVDEGGVCPSQVEICDDGIDNDGDNKVDCSDKKDCGKDPACVGGGATMEICDDGIDNDGDNKVDCSDKKDCGKDPAC